MAARELLYILDTNVLIHDPESIFHFENCTVGIPIIVLEELDKFKNDPGQRGFTTRKAIRYLDALRARGNLKEGVTLDNGSKLQVLFIPPQDEVCTNFQLPQNVKDNQILYTAWCMQQKGYEVKFVSKDINARVKSDVIGIESLDYKEDGIDADQIYKGWIKLQVPSVQLKKDSPEELEQLSRDTELTVNQYVLLESRHNPYNYVVFRYLGNHKFKPVVAPQLRWPLEARNPQQLMALDALFDSSIQLVTLIGPAGTGKTFLALLAALHKVLIEHEYEKILVSRPVIPLGKDIGYLPGDIQEKLHSWMQPIYDNMDFITHSANVANQMAVYKDENFNPRSSNKYKHKRPHKDNTIASLDELIHEGKLSLEAITYMRGRSIPYQFILIDEVQNLTPHEVKTLISRVGEGSKIILAGDPFQIDSPYLDVTSNGLVVAASRFQGQPLFASVYLESSERSELSRLANELL
jgi:PhoH-like ATPase